MSDWAQTLVAKSDQLNNPDLASGPMVIEITGVKIHANDAQKASIYFKGSDKAFRPCLGMRRIMSLVWATNDTQDFIGRAMEIYRDPDVTYGKDTTGGIRISRMSHIDKPQTHTVPIRRGVYKTYTIQPLIIGTQPVTVSDAEWQDLAKVAARQGKAAFTAWWSGNPDGRSAAKAIMDELKQLTEAADDEPAV